MKRTIQQLLHNDVLEEFNGISRFHRGPNQEGWDRLLDSDLGSPSPDGCRAIKSVLEERVCTPFADSVSNPSIGAAYSAILFGSPGTAKTTISEAVAEKMGWDFVVIDTSAFLADGLTNVASRIQYLFKRLQALRNCVILFDEIEEFCLDRETPGLSMESRMLTTAMLTAINDLRRAKQSVFFLATNRLRAFDAAIIRPGRFDIQLFVGTPNLGARVILFEQALSRVSVSEEAKAKAVETYRDFLGSEWSMDGDAMFMNYLEGKQFATSVASIISKGRELEQTELKVMLKQQAAVMTCRGAVRDEYKAQIDLSRL
jgi:SpoVK/Ycf46/Vps4 family AAA+-type ATPase